MSRARTDRGWYLSFAILAAIACLAVYFASDKDALGAAGLIVWNSFVFLFNLAARLFSNLAALLARGVGWKRLSRVVTAVGGIGMGYAASVVLSDEKVAKAQSWRDKLRLFLLRVAEGWRALPFVLKIVIVLAMIAAQLSLHWVLIVFPIGFMVPLVRRITVQIADSAFGAWYWRTLGPWHRRVFLAARRLPLIRQWIGCSRLARMRYLTAWRLWRHDPRYRKRGGGRVVDFIEPLRLWRHGALDHYIARPLLAGSRATDGDRAGLAGERRAADRQDSPD